MKMKLFRRMLIIVIAIAMFFAFATTAFAVVIDTDYWSSTICLYGFTTSNSIVKDYDETWGTFIIYVYNLDFAGTEHNYLKVTPKTYSGLSMGSRTNCAEEVSTGITCTSYSYYNTVKMRIDNPDPGNNMQSNGAFWGSEY